MEAICIKFHQKSNGSGLLKPIWIINEKNDEWNLPSQDNFDCQSGKIFVPIGYDEIENSRTTDLWRVSYEINSRQNGECKYIIVNRDIVISPKKIKSKDLLEILMAELPNPEDGIINNQQLLPVTPYISVLDKNNFIHGVFERNGENADDGIGIRVSLLNSPMFQSDPNGIKTALKIKFSLIPKNNILGAELDGEKRIFIRDPFKLFNDNNVVKEEYMNDEDVLKFGCKALEQTSPNTIKKAMSAVLIKNYFSSKIAAKVDKSIFDRYFKIIENIEVNQNNNFKWAEKFFQSEKGKPVIVNIINNSPDILERLIGKEVDKLKNKAEEKIIDIRKKEHDLELKIKEDELKLQNLRKQIKEHEDKLKNQGIDKQVKINDYSGLLTAEIEEKQKNLDKITAECNLFDQLKGKVKNIEDLKLEQKKLESDNDYIKERTVKLKNDYDNVATQLAKGQEDLTKELFRLKPYIEVLTGFGSKVDELIDFSKMPSITITKNSGSLESDAIDLLETLEKRMLQMRRQYSRSELVNFLVSIQQSFITIFAGLPGVGKTSLVRLLAESLGIQSRLLEVAVGRGWTSNRDLVGYYNPLSTKFQPSSTNVWERLHQIKNNDIENYSNAIILLDEANLSPMEHYWSDFMILTDRPNEKNMKFGMESISIPKNLRFISTINYDATTEPLSPRMLDRAPIIVLQAPDEGIFELDEKTEFIDALVNKKDAWSTKDLDAIFGIPLSEEIMPNKQIFSEIWSAATSTDSIKGRAIALSPRKREAVINFCKKSNLFMRDESEVLSLDYATAQHILPLISGNGEGYRKRLIDLKNIFEKYEMEISLKHIERVLEIGRQDLDSYNFFAW